MDNNLRKLGETRQNSHFNFKWTFLEKIPVRKRGRFRVRIRA